MSAKSIAIDRFGLGARPDTAIAGDPRAWLLDQFDRYSAAPAMIAAVPRTGVAAQPIVDFQKAVRGLREARRNARGTDASEMASATPGAQPMTRKAFRQDYGQEAHTIYYQSVGARMSAALVTPAPFVERLVHFWANHFAVSVEKIPVRILTGPFEFEAIRPHVLGNFRTMMGAAERHPAMLAFLDQVESVGPSSAVAKLRQGRKKAGLNENLAREIMELHTLGVRTGYSQADVTEFARALTGWTAIGLAPRTGTDQGEPGKFAFVDRMHEPGARTIMGKAYAAGGEAQGQAVLDDLARHPATATHIATKLTRHFAGDPVPPAMVARLADAFTRSGGDLPTVYRAIVASPEAWVERPVRFLTPWEWSLATLRAIGLTKIEPEVGMGLMNQLGQQVWKPGQPSGFDDSDPTWAGADGVMRRVEAAERFASRADAPTDVRRLAATLHPDALSPATSQAIARAESPAQALALLLVAPEAMRR